MPRTHRINRDELGRFVQLPTQERQLGSQLVHGLAPKLLKAAHKLAARELAHRSRLHEPAEHENDWVLCVDAELLAEREDTVVRDRV